MIELTFNCLLSKKLMDSNFLLKKSIKNHLQGKIDKAELGYKKIIKAEPNNILANNNLASLMNVKKKYKEALILLDNILNLKPNFIDALNNKGISLMGLNNYEEAIEIYNKLLELKPDFLKAIINKANCLKLTGYQEEALRYYKKVTDIEPKNIEAIFNSAICYFELNEFKDAEKLYNKAINLKPDFIDANFGLSIIKLLNGNYEDGLALYEWRKKRSSFKRYDFYNSKTEWLGDEDLNNKTIFITREQALGDYIQYCRYFKLIEKMGAKIILDVPEQLISMINNMGINYTTFDSIKKTKFDYYCPIASLPYAFKTTLKTIPNEVPYLFTPKNKKNFWEKKLNKNKIKIGLKWSGNPKYSDDKNRSTTLDKFLPLFELPYEFHSLHIEYTPSDEKTMINISNLFCHKNEIVGLDNTAGLIEAMDLVISVDTGIVQLCGALGKKFWNLLPYTSDHRWMLKRNDSPWFPTAKLYRQEKKNDWDKVISKVKKDLIFFVK